MKTMTFLPSLLLLVSCNAAQPLSSEEVLDVRKSMIERVNPATLAIWDVGNNAMSDSGDLDAALMDDAAWTELESAARILAQESRLMSHAEVILAAAPDNLPTAEDGAVSMDEVQRRIDADPEGFRALAAAMARDAEAIVAAARTRDANAAGELVFGLDMTCQTCHVRFWYGE